MTHSLLHVAAPGEQGTIDRGDGLEEELPSQTVIIENNSYTVMNGFPNNYDGFTFTINGITAKLKNFPFTTISPDPTISKTWVDWNQNGIWDETQTGATPSFTHSFSGHGDYYVNVKIRDTDKRIFRFEANLYFP